MKNLKNFSKFSRIFEENSETKFFRQEKFPWEFFEEKFPKLATPTGVASQPLGPLQGPQGPENRLRAIFGKIAKFLQKFCNFPRAREASREQKIFRKKIFCPKNFSKFFEKFFDFRKI